MGAGGTNSDIPDEVLREWGARTKYAPIRLGLSREQTQLPDDVTYNQDWWRDYCKDNDLDPTTGKRLR